MSTYLVVAVAFAASLLQATASNDARVVGTPLAAEEIVRIRDLASERAGGPPWLLMGASTQIAGRWEVTAMGPATQSRAEIRCGTLVRLSGADSDPGTPRAWSLYDSRPYAQIAIPGRAFGEIRGEDDPNLPFWVSGNFSDDELIEVVRFVRSTPPGPDGRSFGLQVERQPIEAVSRFRRTAGTDVHVGVRVSLRVANLQGLVLELERSAGGWIVAQVGGWIA